MKQIKFWNILIFSVMTLQIMVACGDDSDSGDRDETTQTTINGKSFILNHGWGKAYFNNDKTVIALTFSNVDDNTETSIDKVQFLSIYIEFDSIIDEIIPGTYKSEMNFWEAEYSSMSKVSSNSYEGVVSITIRKSGDKYIVTVPDATVNLIYYDEANNKKFKQVPFSFKYTGSLPLSVQN